MAEIHGMDESNVKALETFLTDQQKLNQNLNWKIFNEPDQPPLTDPERQAISITIKSLEDKIDKLQAKIDLIFGNSVLIGDKFSQIK